MPGSFTCWENIQKCIFSWKWIHSSPGSCFKNLLTILHGMWDPSSQPGMEPMPSALAAQSLKHWTSREVPCPGSYSGPSHIQKSALF